MDKTNSPSGPEVFPDNPANLQVHFVPVAGDDNRVMLRKLKVFPGEPAGPVFFKKFCGVILAVLLGGLNPFWIDIKCDHFSMEHDLANDLTARLTKSNHKHPGGLVFRDTIFIIGENNFSLPTIYFLISICHLLLQKT